MSTGQVHDFGLVDDKGDSFEFVIEPADRGSCCLEAVLQTERGPHRTQVAAVPADLWSTVAAAAVRELAAEMGEGEREKKLPTFRAGLNRLSPLVGRELGVLLIALMEEGARERVDALLHAWRELAREERWWLYSKAASPGQRPGAGWRRALFHALSETSETRSAPAGEAQKKKLWEHQEALVAETRSESYTTQTLCGEEAPSSDASKVTQGQAKGRRGKGKKTPKDDPQKDLF